MGTRDDDRSVDDGSDQGRVGNRQEGRVKASNVIDVGYEREEIVRAIRTAVSKPFRESLSDLVNPFGDGRAAERIVEKLRTVPLDTKLIEKRFWDVGLTARDNNRSDRGCDDKPT